MLVKNGSVFLSCKSLKEISFPKLTHVGSSSFKNCTSLTDVDLPLANDLGAYAFANCTSLKTISLPSVTTLDRRVFQSVPLTTLKLTTANNMTLDTSTYGSFVGLSSDKTTLYLNENKKYGGTSIPKANEAGTKWGNATWQQIIFVNDENVNK